MIDARRFKAAEDPTAKDRAVGAAIGSGVSNLVTGYLAAPFLFSGERPFSWKAFKAAPGSHMKSIYGRGAMGKGVALATVATLGGALKEQAQALYEARRKTAETSSVGHSGDLLRVSAPVSAETGAGDRVERRRPKYQAMKKQASKTGIMVYQRDPHELPESERPKSPKGRMSRMFGSKLDPKHALHRRARRMEDEWMGENGEFVEVGNRPGLVETMQEVLGIEGDQVLSRKDVMGMVGEKRKAKSDAYASRKARRKSKEHVHTHAPDDLAEVMKVFKQLLENPSAKYFQVVG